ncbi:hypothetical protein ACVGWG_01315, partial [Enterobacter asburiae]
PRPALSIQMVSRLVQQHEIRLSRNRPAQQGANALAAAQQHRRFLPVYYKQLPDHHKKNPHCFVACI